MKHFVCKSCGNLVATVQFSGMPLGCCNERMHELVPNAAEASREKHTPSVSREGNKVTVRVGRADSAHPMTEEHAIAWVCLVTTRGSHRGELRPEGRAEISFFLSEDEEVIRAFAYCNMHGLWVAECREE